MDAIGICRKCGAEFKKYTTLDVYCSRSCVPTGEGTLKARTKIRNKSKKREADDRLYEILRRKFFEIEKNKVCPIMGTPSVEVHHTHCGTDRAKYYLDTDTWIGVSREGHEKIHNRPQWARDKGYLK